MDNLSQEDDEKEITQKSKPVKNDDDIQFEEAIDLDKLQLELEAKISKGDLDEDEVEDEFSGEQDNSEIVSDDARVGSTAVDSKTIDESDAEAKKYVIYINSDNVEFMESLSSKDRKTIINKILKEQNEQAIIAKEIERRRKFTAKVIIITLTVVIGFPIVFYIVNQALQVTIDNYNASKENFTKLYKEKGKIKPVTYDSIQNFKY